MPAQRAGAGRGASGPRQRSAPRETPTAHPRQEQPRARERAQAGGETSGGASGGEERRRGVDSLQGTPSPTRGRVLGTRPGHAIGEWWLQSLDVRGPVPAAGSWCGVRDGDDAMIRAVRRGLGWCPGCRINSRTPARNRKERGGVLPRGQSRKMARRSGPEGHPIMGASTGYACRKRRGQRRSPPAPGRLVPPVTPGGACPPPAPRCAPGSGDSAPSRSRSTAPPAGSPRSPAGSVYRR